MASTTAQSFSSQPKVISGTRKKFREPGEVDAGLYRDLKETCITWDRRVHRGNTYSVYTQNAIKDALQNVVQSSSPAPRRKRRPKEESIFSLPLPEKERVEADLAKHLTAKEEPVSVETVEAQTDEFLPEPPPEHLQPQRVGVDASTQVEEGELFIFDDEVEPILDVLVNKTLEQSLMETMEEVEMERMSDFKEKWYVRQNAMMKDWELQVEEESRRWQETQTVVARQREERQRQAVVLLKVQAVAAAKQHISRLVSNTAASLAEEAFPDMQAMAIDTIFLPALFGTVEKEVHARTKAVRSVEELVASRIQKHISAQEDSMAQQKLLNRELELRRSEDLQIKRGKLRLLVDDGEGGQVTVGPVQISSEESIEQVQERVQQWLLANHPQLAQAWPHGILLVIDGRAATETAQLFASKPGQTSVQPKPEPPPPDEEEDAEGGDAGNEG